MPEKKRHHERHGFACAGPSYDKTVEAQENGLGDIHLPFMCAAAKSFLENAPDSGARGWRVIRLGLRTWYFFDGDFEVLVRANVLRSPREGRLGVHDRQRGELG